MCRYAGGSLVCMTSLHAPLVLFPLPQDGRWYNLWMFGMVVNRIAFLKAGPPLCGQPPQWPTHTGCCCKYLWKISTCCVASESQQGLVALWNSYHCILFIITVHQSFEYSKCCQSPCGAIMWPGAILVITTRPPVRDCGLLTYLHMIGLYCTWSVHGSWHASRSVYMHLHWEIPPPHTQRAVLLGQPQRSRWEGGGMKYTVWISTGGWNLVAFSSRQTQAKYSLLGNAVKAKRGNSDCTMQEFPWLAFWGCLSPPLQQLQGISAQPAQYKEYDIHTGHQANEQSAL